MTKTILACHDKSPINDMIEIFQDSGIHITPVYTGAVAFSMISDTPYDLLITDDELTDMSGKTLIEKAITQRPFINCAVISQLAHEKFHENYEGLGVLMQLPKPPGSKDVKKLMDHIKKVSGLLEKPKPKLKEITKE